MKYRFLFILVLLQGLHSWASASEIEFDVNKITIRTPYLREAFEHANHFFDFEVALHDYAVERNKSNPSSFIVGPENFLKNSKMVQMLQIQIYQCDQGEISSAHLLSFLLDYRFAFLDDRKKLIDKVRTPENLSGNNGRGHLFFGPTHPELLNKLPEDIQYFSRSSTDRYQFINQLILYVWAMVDPCTLPANVKLKIRCSTMLWKNLTGEQTDLGHPDEAIMTYDEDPKDLAKDWEQYDRYIRKHQTTVTLLNWTKTDTTIFVTPYEKSSYNPMLAKIPEAPYPDWLKPLPQLTKTLQDFMFVVDQSEKPSEQPSAKKIKTKQKKTRTQKKKPSPKLDLQPVQNEDPKLSDALSEPFEETKNEPEVQANVTKPLNEPHQENQQDLIKEPAFPTIIKSGSTPQTVLPSTTVSNLPQELLLRPRGMRMFHSAQPTVKQPIQKLSGTHASTLSKIFNPQQFNNVNFSEVRALWKYINGKDSVDEKKGSSHKKFVALNNQVFSGFAHSDSMTYTRNTIKYVRDMFRQIGYFD